MVIGSRRLAVVTPERAGGGKEQDEDVIAVLTAYCINSSKHVSHAVTNSRPCQSATH